MTQTFLPLPARDRRARHSVFVALLAALLLALFLLPAHAAAPPTPADTEATLAAARKQIDDIRKRVADETDDATLVKQRGDALDIQSKADAAAEALTPQLSSVTARLSELGSPPEGVKEAPDVAAQRMQLEKNSRALDAQIKLARLLSVDAGQAAEQISAQRRTQFQARLGERRDSFLSTQFWTEFRRNSRATWNDWKCCAATWPPRSGRRPNGAGCCWVRRSRRRSPCAWPSAASCCG
jgi:potassium efflux system protein